MHCGHCLRMRLVALVGGLSGGRRCLSTLRSLQQLPMLVRCTKITKVATGYYRCDFNWYKSSLLLVPLSACQSTAARANINLRPGDNNSSVSSDSVDSENNSNSQDSTGNRTTNSHRLSNNDILNSTEAPFLFVAPSKLGLNLKSGWMDQTLDGKAVTVDTESRLRKLNDELLAFTRRVAKTIAAKDVKICEVPPVQSSPEDGPATLIDKPSFGETEPPVAVDDWAPQTIQLRSLPKQYLRLSKARLTGLVVTTAFAGCLMNPEPFSAGIVGLCCLGTAGMAASANTFNQFLEVPFDSQMKRTQARVLVRGELTPLHSVMFGIVAGSTGFATLYYGLNGLTAGLGLLNLVLYSGVYTPMKRMSILNTWVGSVVGALPPLMGWAAASGQLTSGAFVLAGLLYAWQFPHFNALSWNLRPDYSRAGYRMMCVTHPDLCTRTTLRYSVALLGLCSIAAPLSDLTTFMFAIDSIPLNAYFIYLSYKFHKAQDSASSRKLFRYSLVYLPAVMLLMIISKKSWTDSNKTQPNWQKIQNLLKLDNR